MGYIALHNADPERKRARYYALTWSLAITGDGWAVERAWGSLDSKRRQHKVDLVEDWAATLGFVKRHLRRRLQHGYTVKGTDRDGRSLLDQHFTIEEDRGQDYETEDRR